MATAPALRLVGGAPADVHFCASCAAAPPRGATSRVCTQCGMGIVLRAAPNLAPASHEAFLVVDGRLRVAALSASGERLLGVREADVAGGELGDLLLPVGHHRLPLVVDDAIHRRRSLARFHVRRADDLRVTLSAVVGPCGPPPAALVVLGRVGG